MPEDSYIILIAAVATAISAMASRYRTWEGVRRGLRLLRNLLPQFLLLIVLVSVTLGVLSRDTLAHLLGQESGALGFVLSAVIGSVALIPGPIAFPLAGMLLERGVPYAVLAVFITTLMMVGVVTFPVERQFFVTRVAALRNLLSLIGALIVGVIMGILL